MGFPCEHVIANYVVKRAPIPLGEVNSYWKIDVASDVGLVTAADRVAARVASWAKKLVVIKVAASISRDI